MERRNLEILLARKMRRENRYKVYWTCSSCGNPRRSSLVLPSKKCWKCGACEPNYLVIQEAREPKKRHSLTKSKKADFLVSVAKGVTKEFAADVPKVLGRLPSREVDFSDEVFFQIFDSGHVYTGTSAFDPCSQYIPQKVRKDMNKTKMMQIRIPADLHKWFKRYTQLNDVTMTSIVVAYLERLRTRAKNSSDVEQI